MAKVRRSRIGVVAVLAAVGFFVGAWSVSDSARMKRIVGFRSALGLPRENPKLNVSKRQVYTWPESAKEVEGRARRWLPPERGWRQTLRMTAYSPAVFQRPHPRSQFDQVPLLAKIMGKQPGLSSIDVVTITPAFAQVDGAEPMRHLTNRWVTFVYEESKDDFDFISGGSSLFDRGLRLHPTDP